MNNCSVSFYKDDKLVEQINHLNIYYPSAFYEDLPNKIVLSLDFVEREIYCKQYEFFSSVIYAPTSRVFIITKNSKLQSRYEDYPNVSFYETFTFIYDPSNENILSLEAPGLNLPCNDISFFKRIFRKKNICCCRVVTQYENHLPEEFHPKKAIFEHYEYYYEYPFYIIPKIYNGHQEAVLLNIDTLEFGKIHSSKILFYDFTKGKKP